MDIIDQMTSNQKLEPQPVSHTPEEAAVMKSIVHIIQNVDAIGIGISNLAERVAAIEDTWTIFLGLYPTIGAKMAECAAALEAERAAQKETSDDRSQAPV